MNEILKEHREKIKSLGYSAEQADDLIYRLSAIMTAFIDAAWGVHPAQLAKNKAVHDDSGCGRVRTNAKQMIEGSAEAKLSGD